LYLEQIKLLPQLHRSVLTPYRSYYIKEYSMEKKIEYYEKKPATIRFAPIMKKRSK
jgi:hypothetical protein